MGVQHRTLAVILGAFAVHAVALAEDPPAPAPVSVADTLRAEARKLRESDPEAWSRFDGAVKDVFEKEAALNAHWINRAPRPSPDLAPLGLPVPYLAERLLGASDAKGLSTESQAFTVALAKSKDARGLDVVLARHDEQPPRPDRDWLARVVADSVPGDRAPDVVAKQLALKPGMESSELLFLVLRRHADVLPAATRRAGHDWLATWPKGSSSNDFEDIWTLRLRLGDATDRDALIPHIRAKDDILYCLWAIIAAPMPNERLASALRERRERMDEHERSILLPTMRKALLVTDPVGEAASYLARIEELLAHADPAQFPTEESREFDDLFRLVAAVDEPRVRAAARRLVQDARVEWVKRCSLLAQLVRRKDQESESLARWWKENAPEPWRAYLDECIRKNR